jgi:hypothetical protein
MFPLIKVISQRSYTFLLRGASPQKPGKGLESALVVPMFSGAIDPLAALK